MPSEGAWRLWRSKDIPTNLLFLLPGQNRWPWLRQTLSTGRMGPLHFTQSCLLPFLIFHIKRARACASGIHLTEPKELALYCILPMTFPNKTISTRCSKPPLTITYSTSDCLPASFNKGKYCTVTSHARLEQRVLNVDAILEAFLKDAFCLKLLCYEMRNEYSKNKCYELHIIRGQIGMQTY